MRQKDEEIRQKNTQMNQIQVCSLRHFPAVTLITTTSSLTDLQHQLEQLATQLREKDNSLRQREEELQRKYEELHQKDARLEEEINRNRQLTTQLREKGEELRQRNADISRLQGEVQTLQVSTLVYTLSCCMLYVLKFSTLSKASHQPR